MVLGGPTDTDLLSGFCGCHGAETTTVGARNGVLTGFVSSGLVTMVPIGTSSKIVGVLLVVAVGG
jgi:hypothetical protein